MDMTTPPSGNYEHLEGKKSILESTNYINLSKKTTALPTEATINDQDMADQKLNINSTEYFTFHKKEAMKQSNFKKKLLESYGTTQK